MRKPSNKPLKPRKVPIQARSAATVEALHTATIQVLSRDGLSGCTTTRIAERSGISVGSLYQYYPNRDALLTAILDKFLDGIADGVERVCYAHMGETVSKMASALIDTYLAAKLSDLEKSKAMYTIAADGDGAKLATHAYARMATAITMMLASALDAHFDAPEITAIVTLNVLIGSVRVVLGGQATPEFEACLKGQLMLLLTTYFEAHQNSEKRPRPYVADGGYQKT